MFIFWLFCYTSVAFGLMYVGLFNADGTIVGSIFGSHIINYAIQVFGYNVFISFFMISLLYLISQITCKNNVNVSVGTIPHLSSSSKVLRKVYVVLILLHSVVSLAFEYLQNK